MISSDLLTYDLLPHYFMEFDVLYRVIGKFFDTPSRRELLAKITPPEALEVQRNMWHIKNMQHGELDIAIG